MEKEGRVNEVDESVCHLFRIYLSNQPTSIYLARKSRSTVVVARVSRCSPAHVVLFVVVVVLILILIVIIIIIIIFSVAVVVAVAVAV